MPDTVHNCHRCLESSEGGRLDTNGNYHCLPCYREAYSSCASCGCEVDLASEQYHSDMLQLFCHSCFTESMFCCAHCSRLGDTTEARYVPINGSEDRPICRACYTRRWISCQTCGNDILRNTARRTPNSHGIGHHYLCQSCQGREQWCFRPFAGDNVCNEMRSNRKFGIELETSSCPEHNTIRPDTIFGCKEDGSVDGMEFISPPMWGDMGIAEIRKFCEHARRLNFAVDSACGYHVHCDLTNEVSEQLISVALGYHYTYPVWCKFVSRSRRSNYYCAEHDYNPSEFKQAKSFSEFMDLFINSDRYKWINWHAYRQHKTLEIRIHGGTLNEAKIINWIKAHVRFIDRLTTLRPALIARKFAGRSTYDVFQEMSASWEDEALSQYFMERAAEFGSPISRDELVLA